MKLTTQTRQTYLTGVALASAVLLASCSSGIDRDNDSSSGGSNTPTGGLDDDAPVDASYVELEMIDHTSEKPSIVSVLFKAINKNDQPIDSLTIDNFEIREDGNLLPSSESASAIIPRIFLPNITDTVVMLDVSSSISDNDLANMKQAVNELVRDPGTGVSRLFPGQRVAIYTFNDSVYKVKGFSASPSHIVTALESVELPISITPTDLYGAVITGIGLWEDKESISELHNGAIILITDGTDTAGRNTLSSTAKAIGEDKKVFMIGVGEEINQDALEELGTAGFYTVSSFDELGNVLSSIRERMRRTSNSYYTLQYASPKRAAAGKVSNSDHEFEISLVDNDNSKSSGRIDGEFNSYDFSNVTARVMIGGPRQMESGQSATFVAESFWETSSPSYSWQISGDCELNSNEGNKISVTATNSGSCRLSATDLANNNVVSHYSISILRN